MKCILTLLTSALLWRSEVTFDFCPERSLLEDCMTEYASVYMVAEVVFFRTCPVISRCWCHFRRTIDVTCQADTNNDKNNDFSVGDICKLWRSITRITMCVCSRERFIYLMCHTFLYNNNPSQWPYVPNWNDESKHFLKGFDRRCHQLCFLFQKDERRVGFSSMDTSQAACYRRASLRHAGVEWYSDAGNLYKPLASIRYLWYKALIEKTQATGLIWCSVTAVTIYKRNCT